MDWTPTEWQQGIDELAPQILRGAPDPWAALATAELLGIDGLLEQCSLLIQVGRSGASIPVFETLFLGAPITEELPAGTVLTGAIVEENSRDPRKATTVFRDGGLHGRKVCVPAIDSAVRIAVAAADGIYAVRTEDCTITPQTGTNGDAMGILELEGTPATKVAEHDAIEPWLQRIQVGLCALQLGLATQALRMTAKYVKTREQFGRPIATFQAVSQRAADGWIDLQAMDVTLWQAAWRLQEGLPVARELAIARYHAAEGSHRVLAAAQHLHGGMGFDKDYPLHRYFLTSKHWEFLLGGASAQLHALGELLASESAS